MRKLLFLILTIIIFTGCQEKVLESNETAKITKKQLELSENAKLAKKHLEQFGYEVLSYDGDSKQEFTKADLQTLPSRQLWSVQYIEPEKYLDKKIDVVKFTIKNHPLDEAFKMGKTHVNVWLIENEVIGGWSYPISENNDVIGPPYSLDGKTMEEIKGDYSTWLEDWENKYGD